MNDFRIHALAPLFLLLSGATLAAQNNTTSPHWSTLLGGGGREEITAVCRAANGQITVAGFTNSSNLPVARGSQTTAPFQPRIGGLHDGFVARFDPSLPPASQLLWCTYLGGSLDEYLFDAEVAPDGTTTVVGVTESANFPAASGQSRPLLAGRSDGFVCQISPTGNLLQTSMLFGGSGDDRIGAVALDPAQGPAVTIAGTTQSTDLPGTAGGAFATPRGGATDAFVARIDPTQPTGQATLWATYLGGNGLDGNSYTALVNAGGYPAGWELYWDGGDVVHDLHGNITVLFETSAAIQNAPTTAGAFQPTHGGGVDGYVAQLSGDGARLTYASFLGGIGIERVMDLAVEPSTQQVYVVGQTRSPGFPTTAGSLQPTFRRCTTNCGGNDWDGFLSILDPGQAGAAGLIYSTFLGGDGGDDAISSLQLDGAGGVTVAGWTTGTAGFPSTPRSMPGPSPAGYSGVIARILPAGRGVRDLLFASFAGTAGWTWFNDLALDGYGDPIAVGMSDSGTLPMVNAFQAVNAGVEDGLVMHVPMLPGCVWRSDRSLAIPACPSSVRGPAPTTLMRGAPLPGSTFSILLAGTDRSVGSVGYLVLGTAARLPMPHGTLLAQPILTFPAVPTGPQGYLQVDLPIPAGLPAACPWGLAAQWVELSDPTWCAQVLPYQTSERIEF